MLLSTGEHQVGGRRPRRCDTRRGGLRVASKRVTESNDTMADDICGRNNIVTSTDVLKILHTVGVFLQSFAVVTYVVYSLTKCSPAVTHPSTFRFISDAEPKTEHEKVQRHTHTLTSRHKQ